MAADPSPPPTLEDVARIAGLSRATVSRVINGSRNFDPAVHEAVRRAIDATGYVPNAAARSLAARHTHTGTISLVLSGAGGDPDNDALRRSIFTDPFFGRVANGITRFLRPRGVRAALMFAETAEDHNQLIAQLRHGGADGAILVSTHADDPLPELVAAAGLNAVLFARPVRPLPLSYVDLAHQVGAGMAAERLVARGCRNIATISGPLDVPAAQDRLNGFRMALARRGRAYVPHVEGNFTLESGETSAERLLDEFPEVDGVFVANDLMAQGALLTLRERGRRVPGDIAVVGFDDSPPALASRPMLTTVRQPIEDMAAEMTHMLLDRVKQPDLPVMSRIFDPVLVVRQSA